MITLFRRIRQKLINSGSVTKYTLYAIGEIFLVVFGILIALQINNWNENRKLVQEEQYLIQELTQEFEKNLSLVQRDYRGNKETLDASVELLDMFHSADSKVEIDKIDSLLVKIFMSTSYDPSTGVVDEIISTGRLSVLTDDSLRYLITQWPSMILDQREDIEIRGVHFHNILLPAIMESTPFKNSNQFFDFDFWSESYERIELSGSAFDFRPDEFFTRDMESYLYTNSLNQDYILMNDLNTEAYIHQILNRLKENQNSYP